MTRRWPTVAIIGSGFSGTLVTVHLLRGCRTPLRIVLVERSNDLGRGLAYRDQPEVHLLNVRAQGMSAYPEHPDHFVDWVNRHYSPCHPVGPAEFLPRRIYGAYIQAQLQAARAARRGGTRLEIVRDEAVALREQRGRQCIELASGRHVTADAIVLALGNPGPANPPIPEAQFYGSPRYVAHAWSNDAPQSIGAGQSVLLIGAGLTALDWLAALHARGHRGRIEMLSRRGLLPQVHRAVAPHRLAVDPAQLPARVRVLLRAVRSEIAACQSSGGDWRAVIDGLRPYLQNLWHGLPAREQRRFLRHLRPYWEIHRHRAPPAVMAAVDRLRAGGQLRLNSGRLLHCHDRADGVYVQIQARDGLARTLEPVDWVVNCTGPESHARAAQPLLRQLLAEGLACADPLGLGLVATGDGRIVGRDGHPRHGLYAIGPLLKGMLWETTAVPELRVQAQDLARRIATDLEPLHQIPDQSLPDRERRTAAVAGISTRQRQNPG